MDENGGENVIDAARRFEENVAKRRLNEVLERTPDLTVPKGANIKRGGVLSRLLSKSQRKERLRRVK